MKWRTMLDKIPGPWRNPYGDKGRPHNDELHALRNTQQRQRLEFDLLRKEHERAVAGEHALREWQHGHS